MNSVSPKKINKIIKPRGTRDYVANYAKLLQVIFQKVLSIANQFDFKYIDTPIFEYSYIFETSVGQNSDIFQLEMYKFLDRSNRELVLRPEGTSGILRSIYENKLFNKLPLKVFLFGPMFRYERPKFGRYRQFYQASFEVLFKKEKRFFFLIEVILISVQILESLKISDFKIHLSSLGSDQEINNYNKNLSKYFEQFKDKLCNLCIPRIKSNPLRILDCKNETGKDYIINAPKIKLSESHFKELNKIYKILIENFNLKDKVVIDHLIVRGLDYYHGPIFEIKINDKTLAKHNLTVIGGGCYQKNLSKFSLPSYFEGLGFGVGIDRLIDYCIDKNCIFPLSKKICLGYLVFEEDIKSLNYFWKVYLLLINAKLNITISINASSKSLKYLINFALKNECQKLIFIRPISKDDDVVFFKDLQDLRTDNKIIQLKCLIEFLKNNISTIEQKS